MKRCTTQKNERGFSLVELMVVVAIIGVLASLAVPRFKVFQAKARQAEAKTNLAHIYSLEQSYFGDHDTYVKLTAMGDDQPCAANALGFILRPCKKARYAYEVTGAGEDAFLAAATANSQRIWPGCETIDTWHMNQEKDLKPINDVTKSCE